MIVKDIIDVFKVIDVTFFNAAADYSEIFYWVSFLREIQLMCPNVLFTANNNFKLIV